MSPTWRCLLLLLLPKKRTVLWLSSSWDLNSAFADPLEVTPSGSTSESQTPASSPPLSCFPRKMTCFAYIAGSGGHLIGSWDLHKHSNNPKLQNLLFQNLPELSKTKRDLLDSCYTSEHLVESVTTSETFMVRLYKKTAKIIEGIPRMKTEAIMVFKLDEEGNAVYTPGIADQSIYLTKSEAFCVPLTSFLCLRRPNFVKIFDDEDIYFKLAKQKWDC